MRTPEEYAVSSAIVTLMKGVVYRESHEAVWATLDRQGAAVRDHFEVLDVDVVVDDTEGYAYLRARDDDGAPDPLPRLVHRRTLTYNVSLLLVLLRKRMVEFEATSSDTRLVLSRDQIVEMLRLFLPDSSNEARVIDRLDTTIRQVHELGFVRPLRGQRDLWEVRRILKAYVDAQTLNDFAGKLAEYAKAHVAAGGETGDE